MSGGYRGSNGDGSGASSGIVRAVTRQAEAVRELSKPTGAQIAQTLEQVQQLVADLQAQVNNLVNTTTYDRTTIDNKLAQKANTAHQHNQSDINGDWTKGVNTPSAVSAGSVTTSGTAQSATVQTGTLYATGAPGYNITGSRVAGWWETATGRAGMASSSERYKTNIRSIEDVDPEKVLAATPVYYQYTAALERAADDGARPAATEVGMIAERLHELGLWQVVIYQRDGDDNLVLNEDGQPIPEGIHYGLWGVMQQVVLRWMHERITALES